MNWTLIICTFLVCFTVMFCVSIPTTAWQKVRESESERAYTAALAKATRN